MKQTQINKIEWKEIKFLDCLDKEASNNKLKIKQSEFLKEGKYPVIDQGEDFIAGYTNDKSKVYDEKFPVVVFGDHTRALKFVNFPFALGADGVKILVPKDSINVKYFYFVIKNLKLKSLGYSRHYKLLKDKKIPLPFSNNSPDLKEQERIVSILERAEKQKEKSKKAEELLDEYLKSVFNEMFYENGKYQVNALKDLVDEFRFGTSIKSGMKGYPILGIPNVLGEKLILNKCNKVELTEREFNNFKLEINDMLFVRTNGNPNYIGRCGIFEGGKKDYVFASYLIRARLNLNLISPYFLKSYLNSSNGRKDLLTKCRTTAGQYNINTQGLGSLKIPLPSLLLQQKFAQIVEHVEKTKEHINKTKQNAKELFNSLMDKAFRGEL